MNTIPTPLLIIAGVSVCLLLAAIWIAYMADLDENHPARVHGKTGFEPHERLKILGWLWLAPTAAAMAGWMVWG